MAWHPEYDDPGSTLSQRLACVQRHVGDALDARRGPLRVVSACSGDGRDIIGVLAARRDGSVTGARGLDAPTVRVTLLEANPEVATMARSRAEGHGLADV